MSGKKLEATLRHGKSYVQAFYNQSKLPIIKELVSKKIISRSADLYTLDKSSFEKLDRVGDKSISNYLSAIEKSKTVTFDKFIFALGIKEVGEASSKSLAGTFKSLNEFLKCNKDSLIEINDIGPIVADNIIDFIKKSKQGIIKN